MRLARFLGRVALDMPWQGGWLFREHHRPDSIPATRVT